MDLTVRGKALVSKCLDFILSMGVVCILFFAPIFRLEWSESPELTSKDFVVSIEYSTFDYFFTEEVQADLAGVDEYTEALLGVGTVAFDEIKAHQISFGILFWVIIGIIIIVFGIIPQTKMGKKSREKMYIEKGKDPEVEENIENFTTANIGILGNILTYCSIVAFAIVFLASQEFYFLKLAPEASTDIIGTILRMIEVLNDFWLVAYAVIMALMTFNSILRYKAKKEMRKYGIYDRKKLNSMPLLGSTEDYVS